MPMPISALATLMFILWLKRQPTQSFIIGKPMLRILHYHCSRKSECVLAMRISILWITFFAWFVMMLNNVCPIIVTIYFVLFEHLIYCIAILVVEFMCVLVQDIHAFSIGDILKLFFVRWRYFYCAAVLSGIATHAKYRTQNCYYQQQRGSFKCSHSVFLQLRYRSTSSFVNLPLLSSSCLIARSARNSIHPR